ncbi:MAG: threonine--tRNA ligase [Parachlamydiales bacterium]
MDIRVQGHGELSLPEGATPTDVVKKLGLLAPDQAVAVSINGKMRDFFHPLASGDELVFFSFQEPEGKELFWHSAAHVLAQAVLRLFPDAKPTIGPPIANGFYYDFGNLTLEESDLAKIEKEMKKVVKENYRPERSSFASKAEAIAAFKSNPYKVELIESFEEGAELSAYKQGEFFDLCRGPHLPTLGKIKALKILKTSGAYWRGDSEREMLTRIYAIAFPDKEQLEDYLHKLEEAKKRDHKIIGPQLGLFSLKEEAPGIPFIHPKGIFVWNQLIDYLRSLLKEGGYSEIKTPSLMTRDLWEISGHWEHYREGMYTLEVEERQFAMKPMNCPGCILYYKGELHSYREFPLRIAEVGHVHRYEASGALSGLFRVRAFHQDDAHIFLKMEQLEKEIVLVLEFADRLYSTFGLSYSLALSTRPEKGTIGVDEDWDLATQSLKGALDTFGKPYTVKEGDGAFYGPKIDIHLNDALGRGWQCGTVQVDFALPKRFHVEYTDSDGARKTPILVHRAIFGSIERFFGSLIEFYAGAFPLWLSPRQIRILTVADRHADYAHKLGAKFRKAGFEVEVDDSDESVGKKVRSAQLDKVNYILTTGDQEVENKTLSLRTRDNVVHGELAVDTFLKELTKERDERALASPFSKK